jgi:hypothetical protein
MNSRNEQQRGIESEIDAPLSRLLSHYENCNGGAALPLWVLLLFPTGA